MGAVYNDLSPHVSWVRSSVLYRSCTACHHGRLGSTSHNNNNNLDRDVSDLLCFPFITINLTLYVLVHNQVLLYYVVLDRVRPILTINIIMQLDLFVVRSHEINELSPQNVGIWSSSPQKDLLLRVFSKT